MGGRGLERSIRNRSGAGGEYSLTFFSEARLTALEQRLGHDSVSRMYAQISTVIAQRMRSVDGVPAPATDSDRLSVFGIDKSFIASCTQGNVPPLAYCSPLGKMASDNGYNASIL
jgi:hypothetical protein